MSLFTDDKLYNLQRISEDGGVIFSSETRAKIGASNRGRTLPPRSAEHSAKISAAKKAAFAARKNNAKD